MESWTKIVCSKRCHIVSGSWDGAKFWVLDVLAKMVDYVSVGFWNPELVKTFSASAFEASSDVSQGIALEASMRVDEAAHAFAGLI